MGLVYNPGYCMKFGEAICQLGVNPPQFGLPRPRKGRFVLGFGKKDCIGGPCKPEPGFMSPCPIWGNRTLGNNPWAGALFWPHQKGIGWTGGGAAWFTPPFEDIPAPAFHHAGGCGMVGVHVGKVEEPWSGTSEFPLVPGLVLLEELPLAPRLMLLEDFSLAPRLVFEGTEEADELPPPALAAVGGKFTPTLGCVGVKFPPRGGDEGLSIPLSPVDFFGKDVFTLISLADITNLVKALCKLNLNEYTSKEYNFGCQIQT